MTVTISRYLKLRIDSGLTANAKYNLNRIDLLGASIDAITEDASVLGFLDIAEGGSKRLRFRYKTDITGSVDTVADRLLSIDLQGADRSLTLGGNLLTSGGDISLAATANTSLILPTTGTLATLAGSEALSNKTQLTVDNIRIDGQTISTVGGDGNMYIAPSTYLFLNPTAAVILGGSGASVQNSNPNIGGIINFRESTNSGSHYLALRAPAVITNYPTFYFPNALTDQTLVGDTTPQAISNKLSLGLTNGSFQAIIQASGSQAANYTLTLPIDDGANGQILTTNGSGVLAWQSAGSGTGDVEGFVGTWITADTTTKVVTHNLLSSDPDVTVIDNVTNEIVLVDSIVATSSNSITLVSSEAPSSSWRVVVQAKP